MAPRTNFQLARIFGIRVGVGISWFVVLFVFIIFVTPIFHSQLGGSRTTAYLVAVASVLSFFVSLVLHELGHALVARRSGLQVAGIDLWALGGITRTEESNDPKHGVPRRRGRPARDARRDRRLHRRRAAADRPARRRSSNWPSAKKARTRRPRSCG